MKPRRLSHRGATALMTLGSICLTLTVSAESLYKEDNADNLNLGSSWEFGAVPGAADVASWDSLVSSENVTDLGANLSWSGISISNPSGPVTINGTNTLTLGAGGVVLTGVAPPLTLNSPLILGADQSWDVASGSILNVNGVVSGSGILTKKGTGNLVFAGNQSNTFTGPFVLDTTGTGIGTSTIFAKTSGAVAVPANSVITFGNGLNGQANLRMMESNQFGAGTLLRFINPAGSWARFDLMATNQTLAGLQAGTPATGINAGAVIQNREINGTANRGLSLLTLNGNLTDPNYPVGGYHFNGYIRDADSGDNAGNLLGLVKNGTGTQALSGNQLGYEGGTTVNGGVLDFVTANAMDNARGLWTVNAGGMIRAVAAHNVYGGINLNGGELAGSGAPVPNYGHLVLHGTVTVGGSVTSKISADFRIGNNADQIFNVGVTGDPSGIDLDFTGSGRLGHLNNVSWGFMTKNGPGTLRFNNPGDIGRITHNQGKIIFNESTSDVGNGGLINHAAVEIINSGDLVFGGAIHGSGSVVKKGAGLLSLTSTGSSYTGTVEIAEGDLAFANNSGLLNFAGDISGPGSLTKSGAGTAVLTGNLTYTGGTFITGGILSVPGEFNEDLTVSSGGGYLGGEKLKSLALADANYYSSGSPLAITGNLSLTGDNWVYLAAPPALGTADILLMTYGGTLTGNGANLSFPDAAKYRGTPVFTASGGQVKLGGLVFKSLIWTGAENDSWDLLTTPNWSDGGAAETFASGDAVVFDDSSPFKTVNLPAASLLSPSLVTFNNSAGNDYSIAGNGVNRGFTGGTSIVKNGSGTVTIQGFSHNYTGTVTINAGVLQPNGNYELLGNSSGVTVNAGGQLNINGMNLGNGTRHYSLTIAGQGPDGQGAITNTAAGGPASNAGLLNLELSADAAVGGNGGRFDIGRSGSIVGTVDGNGHTLTKVGTGNVTMRGNASEINYVVNGGSFKFEDTDSATGTNTIVVNAGTLQGWGNRSFPNNLQFAAGTALDSDGGGTQAWTGNIGITSPGNLTLAARAGGLILTGVISGEASVTKTGGNVLQMLGTASNTFTGKFLLPTDASGTTFLGKTGGALAIPAGATIEFGTTVLTGQANLRMLEDNQFGAGAMLKFNNPWGQWSRFDLMGTDQSLAGLMTGTPAQAGGGVVQNREIGGSAVRGLSVLTLTGNTNDPGYPEGGYYFNGHLRDSDSAAIDPSNQLEIVKNGSGTQELATSFGQDSRISFSGNLTVNGGKMVGSGIRRNEAPGNWGAFGAGLRTRTITVNSGAVLEFAVANMFGGHSHTNVPTLVVNGGTVTNRDRTEPDGKVNNGLNNVVLNGGTLTSTTGNSISVISASRPGEGYGAWGINGSLTSTGTSTISTSSPAGSVLLGSAEIDTVFNVADGTLTVSAPLQDGESSVLANLVKDGAGTLVLSAANIHTTNTIINGGSVVLTDTGSMRFKVSDLVSNKITGTGSVSLNGRFAIDTSAVVAETGTWTLVDVGSLTESYGAGFTLGAGWSGNGGVWTRTAGDQTWTFSQASGELSLGATVASGYGTWIGSFGLTGDAALPGADPDNDGISNAVEMVLGGNPNDAMNAALMPTLELVTNPNGIPAGNYLLFTYRRTDLSVAAGVNAAGQYSSGLSAPWSTAVNGESGVVVMVDNDFASFTPPASAPTDRVRVYIPRLANDTLFGRLSVMVP